MNDFLFLQAALKLLLTSSFRNIKIIPTIAPTKKAIKSVNRVSCQPRKAPIMAPNFISPPPIPPLLKMAMAHRIPPPANNPKEESMRESILGI